jgi:hypothetical protein
MALKYSDKPQLNYSEGGGSKYVNLGRNLPANGRSMGSAPTTGSRPIIVYDASSNKRVWALHHLGSWQEVEAFKDPYTGARNVRMNGNLVRNPIVWWSS